MSASHHRRFCSLIAAAAILVSIVVAGCASQSATQTEVPDQSVLDPATQALDKAMSAHADQFAPRIVDSARRRITVARDILFQAAQADRSPTDTENDRIQKLVDQARLDARAALIKTQAGAVDRQIKQLQGGGPSELNNNGTGQSNSGSTSGGPGLGISSFGQGSGPGTRQGNNTLGGSQ